MMRLNRGMTDGKLVQFVFQPLESICDVLDCQPGDILEYKRIKGD